MESNPVPPYRMIGEAFASYILLELDDKLILVDKHAAHERINFERLRANMQTDVPYIQMILVPETLAFSAEELALVKEYEKELQACGFAFTVDEHQISLSGIPFGFEKDDAVSLFISLIAEAEKGIPVDQGRQNAFEEMLYQSSCKASVKAGRVYDTAHLRWICDNLFRYDCIKFCPHGRPVAFELSKKELDTRFGRT
jgi:DNA mismatch repair protein MutL